VGPCLQGMENRYALDLCLLPIDGVAAVRRTLSPPDLVSRKRSNANISLGL
jgi:hypothetical protein